MNVALRLISLSPPAFQPIHFAPRTQTAGKSSFSRRANLRATQSKNSQLSPLCFHGLTNCFSRNPFIFKNICVAPPGVPPKRLFRNTTTSTCRPGPPILFIINQLRTLVLSCGSFPHSHPLFSTSCRLFVQKQGGGGTLRIRTYAQLSLSALCVLCGASAFPALSFPSFGGPKNADAR